MKKITTILSLIAFAYCIIYRNFIKDSDDFLEEEYNINNIGI